VTAENMPRCVIFLVEFLFVPPQAVGAVSPAIIIQAMPLLDNKQKSNNNF
jgi:hypothetical protein